MVLRGVVMAALGSVIVISGANAHEVCTAVADAATGQVLIQRGDCQRQVTPASTFKIAISLMGYDSGFLKDEHTPKLPFLKGYVDWRANWREPTDPTKWMKDSVVWYSQQVTRSMGQERFAEYTKKFQYGNSDVSGDAENDGLTMSWISSSLRISPLEQLSFLTKVVNRQLGVSEHAYDMTAKLTKFGQLPGGWNINGKYGAASGFGWYVGWVLKGPRTFVFARLIQKDEAQPQDVPAGILARDSFIKEFPALVAPLAQ
ncbi:class D beta-lactamase [Undibacterium sp.]|jgi:beta-lactamase class D|uniref:class D beta-lactamase n=1 Tax=Undibacterium sp. TaxID=1914977 RepID=UPI002C542CE8|nr:class D beta-lactamase [Undibacterium sp.]HTD05695.1 class D beta-lactamase [Undibacterium sp.]